MKFLEERGTEPFALWVSYPDPHTPYEAPRRLFEAARERVKLSPWRADEFDGAPERLKVLLAEVVAGEGAPGTVLDDTLTVACGERAVRLRRVQRAGKSPVDAADFLRGARVATGDRFEAGGA